MSTTEDSKTENKKGNKKKAKVKVFDKKQKKNTPESQIIEKLIAKYDTIDSNQITKFSDFPLSSKTLKGLRECGYHKPTEIQRETIGLALQKRDILGAAQTGSGKTLAFLIPVLEALYVNQWQALDGVGALVITPTRELAYQIFETLRRIGKYHDFSAGLIIGGKDLKFERTRMDKCNIIICTPGRLLQHMDENPLFDCTSMKVLVLDEADRCLDMGFEPTMNAIIDNLPPVRQTLLFSATQTRSVKDLARLSLCNPSYVSVHEHNEYSTPKELSQSYIVCQLHEKIAVLWSFLKNHPNKKIMVFFASCKQVKYTYEIFCKLRPGSSLIALYGTLHQLKRMEIYESFCRKQSAILFATDLAARGLDFPGVHWVVQVDCPEDPETYIHRVGRTARYQRGGESMLILLPQEEGMVEKLKEKKIPIEKIEINPLKLNNPIRKMEAILAKDSSLKDSAQRAFVSYVKAVFLMKDKSIFNVHSLDTDSFAKSLGLIVPPRIRFLQRMNARMEKQKQNKTNNTLETVNRNNKKYFNYDSENENNDEAVESKSESEGTGMDIDNLFRQESGDDMETISISRKKKKSKNDKSKEENVVKDESNDSGLSGDDNVKNFQDPFQIYDDSDGEAYTVTPRNVDIELPTDKEIAYLNIGGNKKKKPISKAAAAKNVLKKKLIPNKKIIFDDEGTVIPTAKDKKSELAIEYENEEESGINIEKSREVMRAEDKFDKQLFKEKVKAKHKEEKRKMKLKKQKEKEEEVRDEFGESESEVEPDLSWLPDPDAVYGKKTEEEVDRLLEDVQDETVTKPYKTKKKDKKRKSEQPSESLEPPAVKNKKQKLKEISSSLSVTEAEELAMLLLQNKK